MSLRRTLLPFAVVALLAGCGDDSDSSSTTTAPSTTTSSVAASTSTTAAATTTSASAAATGTPAAGVDPKHLCTVLTVADLNSVLNGGFAETNAPTDDDACVYYTREGARALRAQGNLEVKLTGAKADWEALHRGDQPVSGLGDAAFTSKSGELTYVDALKGDASVELAIGNGVTATEDQFRTLINLAFQRLGL